MNASTLLAAIDIPPSARVGQRVPKKLLAEHGAQATADRRKIEEGIEEVRWAATLKPSTVGVPAYRDANREYVEVAILHASFRPKASVPRLLELIHRAIPYPVVLVVEQEDAADLSLAHKRWSQGAASETVVDGAPVIADIQNSAGQAFIPEFLHSLGLNRQPLSSLYALYQGWIDTVLAFQAAWVTGVFAPAASPEARDARHRAIKESGEIDAQIAALVSEAQKERQVARQVELNLEIQRLRACKDALQRSMTAEGSS